MHTSLAISSVLLALVVAGGACGGKAKARATTGSSTGGGGGAGDQLPWEAALTSGATFELGSDLDVEDGGGEPVTVTVAGVDRDGAARIYRLEWSDGGNGPTSIRVKGGKVTIGDAKLADMQEPWQNPTTGDATCYAEDLSNPDGCDDICDASLCLSPTGGITEVFGRYAPGHGSYSSR